MDQAVAKNQPTVDQSSSMIEEAVTPKKPSYFDYSQLNEGGTAQWWNSSVDD